MESGRWGNPIGNRPEPERMLYAWLGALVLQFVCFFASCDDFFVGQVANLRPIGNRPIAASIRPAGGLATRYRMRIWPNIRQPIPLFMSRTHFQSQHISKISKVFYNNDLNGP
jgi:hypothetical protein